MNALKKTMRVVGSMAFAMSLLVVMAIACVAGSVIPQGNLAAWYQQTYPRTSGLILALKLDDLFHSLWFLALAVFLCLSLILCNLIRFPRLIRRMKTGFTLETRLKEAREPIAETSNNPRPVFQKLGFRRIDEGSGNLYAARNRLGIWGAWLCHLGILLIIIAFGFGEAFQFETSVYGFPGQTLPVEGTDYTVTIDSFDILLREDETVDQYRAGLTVTDPSTGKTSGGIAQVNTPVSAFGLKFYQNSTGWGAGLTVEKEGRVIQEETLCAGEYADVTGLEELHVMLRAVYPDHATDAEGKPYSKTSAVVNPAYLYALYYGDRMLGMNLLTGDDQITVDSYTITFHDPQAYTLIQIKHDPFEGLAALGGGIMLLALLLAFYLFPAELWAVEEDGIWKLYGKCLKAAQQFPEDVRRMLKSPEK